FAELSDADADRLMKAEAMLFDGADPGAVLAKFLPGQRLGKEFNPDEPRDERGRWTDGGVADGSANAGAADGKGASPKFGVELAAAVTPATEAEKEKFTDDHLVDAQKFANKLQVPVENVLGLSAFESGWGKEGFASAGNNYLGIHYPALLATGYVVAKKSNA